MLQPSLGNRAQKFSPAFFHKATFCCSVFKTKLTFELYIPNEELIRTPIENLKIQTKPV